MPSLSWEQISEGLFSFARYTLFLLAALVLWVIKIVHKEHTELYKNHLMKMGSKKGEESDYLRLKEDLDRLHEKTETLARQLNEMEIAREVQRVLLKTLTKQMDEQNGMLKELLNNKIKPFKK